MKGDTKPVIIRGNPYAGKKLKFSQAPTIRVASLTGLSEQFMKKIVGLDPGDYFITDESRLSDFTDFGSGDTSCLLNKIKRIFNIDVTDIPKGNLVDIFEKINLIQKE